MFNNKKFLLIILFLTVVVSIGIASASQLDNSNEDNIILKQMHMNNECLGKLSTTNAWISSWLVVNFNTNQYDLHNGEKCRIEGHVDRVGYDLKDERVHVYIDGKYVEDIILNKEHEEFLNSYYYNDYKFHDLSNGEHSLLLKYDGKKESWYLPDTAPCEYSCKIYVSNYSITVNPDATVKVGDSEMINGTLVNNGIGVANAKIYAYIDDNDKFKESIITDDEGHFKYNFTSEKSGNHVVHFKYVTPSGSIVENTCNVNVENNNYTIIGTSSNVSVNMGETVMLNGTLLKNGKPVYPATIWVYFDNQVMFTLRTDSNGHFYYNHQPLHVGDYDITYKYNSLEGVVTYTCHVSASEKT